MGKILFLPPLKLGIQCIYCNNHLYYLILNSTVRPWSDWGKTTDNAIILRDNTGSDILIDIIISLDSNLHSSEEDHYTLKTNADILCRTSVVSKHCAYRLHQANLVFYFLPQDLKTS